MSSTIKAKSLKDVLLIHELTFILLVILAGTAGVIGMRIWDQSSQESQRINLMVQEIQQTRGDLYRQMKELFDMYFLKDPQAQEEYNVYTHSIDAHFQKLLELTVDEEEKTAITELHASYQAFVVETQDIFSRPQDFNNESLEKALNTHLESGIFHRYEIISARAERLLLLKQNELSSRLEDVKHTSITLLMIRLAWPFCCCCFRGFSLNAPSSALSITCCTPRVKSVRAIWDIRLRKKVWLNWLHCPWPLMPWQRS
ncbi:CHASE3 domain-containing protein [Methylobacillus glycogenes]|uniref:CHASE3 domain-containing protein n=1 Tax=Methylobacillus glycogenes TaxID=406 RepID=UPI000ADB0C48